MGLRSEMDHDVALRHQLRDKLGVGDVTFHQADVVSDEIERRPIPGVGERVQNSHRILRVFTHRAVDEVGADEARTASYQEPHGQKP